jgi:hypothetical protein
MPNWSLNKFSVKGTAEDMVVFYAAALSPMNEFKFANIFPMPAILKNTVSPTRSAHNFPEAENNTPEKCARLIEAYGADNWYDWNHVTYGTKWDLQETMITQKTDVLFECHFKTAWAPPYTFLQRLQHKYPNLALSLWYCVEGDPDNMGVFNTITNDLTGEKTIDYTKLEGEEVEEEDKK